MNYDAIMDRIDNFFENVDAQLIMESLEKKGYVFEEFKPSNISQGSYETWRPKDIGNRGEYISTKEKRATNSCSFFLSLN